MVSIDTFAEALLLAARRASADIGRRPPPKSDGLCVTHAG